MKGGAYTQAGVGPTAAAHPWALSAGPCGNLTRAVFALGLQSKQVDVSEALESEGLNQLKQRKGVAPPTKLPFFSAT